MNKPVIFSTLIFFILFGILPQSFAQLSPGKLTTAHSKLESLSNCTQCHAIGAKVLNQKCLACHKDLNAQVSKNEGFHVSSFVKGKECIVCHSEHHGTGFEMIRFDKKTFNHNLTGYELKGSHKTKITNCNECHKSANISSASLRNKPKTYLGLDTKCSTCHEDFHQKTLSNDCASCHDFNDFKKAPFFNHTKTSFALLGEHKNTDCVSCHKQELRNGKKFVNFSGVSINCASCHKDVHKGKFGSNCKSCHSEESFHKITPSNNFNHTSTGFTLEGKHKEINCTKCHNKSVAYQEFAKINDITCINCHKDIHEGKLGKDCKSCHNQNSFLLKGKAYTGKFDHNKTAYPLEGKHQNVDCRVCHKGDLTDPLPHGNCMNCHNDKHNGDFATKKDKYPDCATCHNVEGFTPSLYTVEMHNKSKFRLENAHLAQPCFSCHLIGQRLVFNNLETNCINCHKDIHEGVIDQKYYGKQSCSTCHNTINWQKITFDHKTTTYDLVGAHSKTQCSSCHFSNKTNPPTQQFKGISKKCSVCHKDVHDKQFEINGMTDCARCHGMNNWKAENFNHDNTNYKLDGKHKTVACEKCHKVNLKDNRNIRTFKIAKYQCIDCHSK